LFLYLVVLCLFSYIATQDVKVQLSKEFQIDINGTVLINNREAYIQFFKDFLQEVEDGDILPFPFKIKKTTGVVIYRNATFYDTADRQTTKYKNKIRYRNSFYGNNDADVTWKFKAVDQVIADAEDIWPKEGLKDSAVKIEQNYHNKDNYGFERSASVKDVPKDLKFTQVKEVEKYFPDYKDVNHLTSSTPLQVVSVDIHYLYADVEFSIDKIDLEGGFQFEYASLSALEQQTLPHKAEFAWKIKADEDDKWDISLLKDSYYFHEYLYTHLPGVVIAPKC